MKEKKRGRIKRTAIYLVNFPRWMGWGHIKGSAKSLKNLAKFVVTPDKPKHNENFEEAMERLNINEEDLKKQASRHMNLTIFFLLLTLGLLIYSIYLLTQYHFQGFILGVFVSALAASFAFREHFYYFQIKTRRLGCNFQDWLNFVLRRAKK